VEEVIEEGTEEEAVILTYRRKCRVAIWFISVSSPASATFPYLAFLPFTDFPIFSGRYRTFVLPVFTSSRLLIIYMCILREKGSFISLHSFSLVFVTRSLF